MIVLAVSGHPLETTLIIRPLNDIDWGSDQQAGWIADQDDGSYVLGHNQALQILDAWKTAPGSDLKDPYDTVVVREFTYDEPDEIFWTALYMDGEINLSHWRNADGFHMEDMPFDFEVELLDAPEPHVPLDDPRPPAWDLYSEICAVIDRVKLDERTKDTDVYASAIEALIERSKR